MNITYKLQFEDFLEHQLYIASQSKAVIRKRRNNRLIVPVFYAGIGAFLYFERGILIGGCIFALLGILWYFLYPLYSKFNYRNHYKKHIEENSKNRVGKTIELSFDKEYIYTKDSAYEGKTRIDEINQLVETKNHFFIRLKSDMSYIIPKSSITNINSFVDFLKNIGVSYIDEQNWEWR